MQVLLRATKRIGRYNVGDEFRVGKSDSLALELMKVAERVQETKEEDRSLEAAKLQPKREPGRGKKEKIPDSKPVSKRRYRRRDMVPE